MYPARMKRKLQCTWAAQSMRTVRSLRLHHFAAGREQHGGHEPEAAEALRDNVALHVACMQGKARGGHRSASACEAEPTHTWIYAFYAVHENIDLGSTQR